jgi:hypothetical protein
MYQLSQGIIDIAVKLYMLAQWEAIGDAEKITVPLLKHVAKRDLQLVQPVLKLLTQNNIEAMEMIDDLYPKWGHFNDFLQRSMERVHLEGEVRTHIHNEEKIDLDQEKYIELIKTAVNFGASSDIAEQLAKNVLKNHEAEQDLVILRKAIVELLTSLEIKCESEKTSKTTR